MVRLNEQLPKIGWLSLISLGITVVLVALLRYIAKILVALVLFIAASGTIGKSFCPLLALLLLQEY